MDFGTTFLLAFSLFTLCLSLCYQQPLPVVRAKVALPSDGATRTALETVLPTDTVPRATRGATHVRWTRSLGFDPGRCFEGVLQNTKHQNTAPVSRAKTPKHQTPTGLSHLKHQNTKQQPV